MLLVIDSVVEIYRDIFIAECRPLGSVLLCSGAGRKISLIDICQGARTM